MMMVIMMIMFIYLMFYLFIFFVIICNGLVMFFVTLSEGYWNMAPFEIILMRF